MARSPVRTRTYPSHAAGSPRRAAGHGSAVGGPEQTLLLDDLDRQGLVPLVGEEDGDAVVLGAHDGAAPPQLVDHLGLRCQAVGAVLGPLLRGPGRARVAVPARAAVALPEVAEEERAAAVARLGVAAHHLHA